MNNISGIKKEECTGCGCCYNICPQGAISKEEDDEGFFVPVVNDLCNECGACLTKCPARNYNFKNDSSPKPIAGRASDEIREKSSSGGIFKVLADWFLSNNGYVCGAVFDDYFRLHHIVSNSLDDVERMRGSKYLQSDTELVYKQIKELLVKDQKVFFTGTPCQVAALYNFLGEKKYDNLYTADLVCHGVPSQHSFNDYLAENHEKQIKQFDFRSKTNGWRGDCIDVHYDDGSTYHGNMQKDLLKPMDSYEIGFQKNLILRRSCENCKFCTFPRVGDITLGDFWGINRIDASQNDGKGTSMIFVNNEKGKELLDFIQNEIIYEKIDISINQIPNRLKEFYPHHSHRQRFFDMRKSGFSFNEAVSSTHSQTYDVGIVGIYTVGNFGGALTYYALYHAVNDLGYTSLMIERPNESAHKPNLTKIYSECPYPEYAMAKVYDTKEQMAELNGYCKNFLVGSDQLFNDFLYNQFGRWVTLDWVEDNKRKIAYAASFGHDFIWHPEETRAEMSYFMKKFDAFSVREESGVDICKKDFGVAAEWVLDPVFLCQRKYYDQLIEKSDYEFPEHFLGAYILDLSKNRQKILERISDQLSLPCSIFSEMNWKDLPRNGWSLEIENGAYINDRLKNIAQCEFFVADSFHGICFAIIYRKNFIAILNQNRGASRFITILGKLGLMERLIQDTDDLSNIDKLLTPIDYDEVYEKLDKERERCKKWLVDSLNVENKKSYSDYHYIKKFSIEQKSEINRLRNQNKELKSQLNTLHRCIEMCVEEESGRWKRKASDILNLANENNICSYLDYLKKRKSDYLVILTIRDNVGCCMNTQIESLLKSIGCSMNWCTIPKRTSYVFVSNKGNVVFNDSNFDKETICDLSINSLDLHIESRLHLQGNLTQIFINQNDFAVNQRGINIVTYDCETDKLIDSVCFDTHVKEFRCYR